MTVHPHQISREEGNGAGDEIDDKYDGEEYQTKDQRSENRTTYYRSDIDTHVTDPRQARQLERALRWQEGEYVTSDKAKSRGQQNREEDKRRVIGALGSQLDLTGAQKERIRHLVIDVMSVNSFGPYSMEQVVLATINVVARERGRWIEDEDQFRDYVEQVGLTNENGRADMETVKSLRGLVRERVPSKS